MSAQATVDTRDRLLQAARSLMWERSYQAAGVDELCRQANAKKGSFYHFFRSKTELAVAAIESSWASVEASIFVPVFSTPDSGLCQLRTLFQKVYELQKSASAQKNAVLGCPFGSLGQEMAHQDEQIRDALQVIFRAHCGYLERALARAEAAGEIRAGDNKQRAESLFSLLQGALLLSKVNNDLELFQNVAATAGLAVAGAVHDRQPANAHTC